MSSSFDSRTELPLHPQVNEWERLMDPQQEHPAASCSLPSAKTQYTFHKAGCSLRPPTFNTPYEECVAIRNICDCEEGGCEGLTFFKWVYSNKQLCFHYH